MGFSVHVFLSSMSSVILSPCACVCVCCLSRCDKMLVIRLIFNINCFDPPGVFVYFGIVVVVVAAVVFSYFFFFFLFFLFSRWSIIIHATMECHNLQCDKTNIFISVIIQFVWEPLTMSNILYVRACVCVCVSAGSPSDLRSLVWILCFYFFTAECFMQWVSADILEPCAYEC